MGEVPAEFVREATGGIADWQIPVSLNRTLMEDVWDLIINVGHVVPHEVLGFANHNKNYFIGLGGKDLICTAHMLAARCGIENNLGRLVTPLRTCFNWAENEFLGALPDVYVQIVMARDDRGELVTTGLHVGNDLETYLAAAPGNRRPRTSRSSTSRFGRSFVSCRRTNSRVRGLPIRRSTEPAWRIADGGELVIIAPGLKRFGEQSDVDALIRRIGYVGTPRVMDLYRNDPEMWDLAHATAHLLHGSSEGRFRITYAPGYLSREEIEGINFAYADLADTVERYRPDRSKEGWNQTADGEEYFFIPTPSAGLWMTRDRLDGRPGDDACRTKPCFKGSGCGHEASRTIGFLAVEGLPAGRTRQLDPGG